MLEELDPSHPLTASVVLTVLLALSAFFSMSETALVRADPFVVRERAEAGSRGAKRLQKLLDHPERMMSTILVGNNLVNIAAASLATFLSVELFGASGAIYATLALTAAILLFSEITPKTIAVRHPEGIAIWGSAALLVMEWILLPFARLMSLLASGLLRLFGIKQVESSTYITTDDIERMVRVGTEEGDVEEFEKQVIEEVFDFTETPVRQVMTPRSDIEYLQKTASLQQGLQAAANSGHSRILVVDGTLDDVLGFFHVKDLLTYTDQELRDNPVSDLIRSVISVRGGLDCHKALARMQRKRTMMALVRDTEDQTIGLVTVEDLLEEIVGEILDEFDDER